MPETTPRRAQNTPKTHRNAPKPSRKTTVRQASATETGHILRLARTFDAPRERVWAAWTDPAMLRRWWGPERFTVPHCEMDVRPGGKWRTCMRSPEGTEHWVSGTYREIAPPERLAFTWAWEADDPGPDRPGTRGPETLVVVELHDRGGGRTEVVLTHANFETEEGRDDHETGWTSALVCLEQFLREEKEG